MYTCHHVCGTCTTLHVESLLVFAEEYLPTTCTVHTCTTTLLCTLHDVKYAYLQVQFLNALQITYMCTHITEITVAYM